MRRWRHAFLLLATVILTSTSLLAADSSFTSTNSTVPPPAVRPNLQQLSAAHDYISRDLRYFHSLLVIHDGQTAFEHYYGGFNERSLNNIKSCTKSVTSVLIGIALKENLIRDTNQKLSIFYPEFFETVQDPAKREIALSHLLSMTAGFAWTDNGPQMDRWWNGDDLVKAALTLPMAQKPGQSFNYCSPASHLLSATLAKSARTDTLDFAKTRLFEPLGISQVEWSHDRKGINYGFGELSLTTRDLGKIGLLYLNNGRWDQKQIVDPDWVKQSTQVQVRTSNPVGDYGYGWWVRRFGTHDCFFAAGWGGQHLFVVPDLKLVVVTTQDWNLHDALLQHESPFRLMENSIIPAFDPTLN